VLTLQQGRYGYQFRQLAWVHLIVFFTVVPSSFFVPLIFEGLIWFFLPLSLIIVNDIMAYLAGALSQQHVSGVVAVYSRLLILLHMPSSGTCNMVRRAYSRHPCPQMNAPVRITQASAWAGPR
jgi:Cytidylyltransferase family